eukprot:4240810-Lingulodinium_polyedra.AAC.1
MRELGEHGAQHWVNVIVPSRLPWELQLSSNALWRVYSHAGKSKTHCGLVYTSSSHSGSSG